MKPHLRARITARSQRGKISLFFQVSHTLSLTLTWLTWTLKSQTRIPGHRRTRTRKLPTWCSRKLWRGPWKERKSRQIVCVRVRFIFDLSQSGGTSSEFYLYFVRNERIFLNNYYHHLQNSLEIIFFHFVHLWTTFYQPHTSRRPVQITDPRNPGLIRVLYSHHNGLFRSSLDVRPLYGSQNV